MPVTLYGIHPVLEALKKRPRAFHRIVVSRQGAPGAVQEVLDAAAQARIRVEAEPAAVLQRLCGSGHHQGVVADVEPFGLADIDHLLAGCRQQGRPALLLVLDSIQDPHNFGALLRSAVCSGVQAVLFPKDKSVRLTGTVAKASAGAIEHIALCRVVNIAATLARLKQEHIWVAGLFPEARESIYTFDFAVDLAIVLGNEEKGIRPLVGRHCDFHLSIPLQAGFDSLNASVAGAVVLFEAMRQRSGTLKR
jgi:23S rRNA (guanosine2251-2'-O)-methyltransferase